MIRVTGRGIVVAGVSDISGMAVIAIVAVVAGLTGAAGTADASNIAGIASGRVVVVKKVGILAVCVGSSFLAALASLREVGGVHYMVTVDGGYPRITGANQRESAGFPPISGIKKATVDPVIMTMTSIPLRILIGLAAMRMKETVQPIACNLA